MTPPAEIIEHVCLLGCCLSISGGRLKCVPTPQEEILREMRDHKNELIRILSEPPEKDGNCVKLSATEPTTLQPTGNDIASERGVSAPSFSDIAPLANGKQEIAEPAAGVPASLVFDTAMALIGMLPKESSERLLLTDAWNKIDIADDSYPDELASVLVSVYRKLLPGYAAWFTKWEKAHPVVPVKGLAA